MSGSLFVCSKSASAEDALGKVPRVRFAAAKCRQQWALSPGGSALVGAFESTIARESLVRLVAKTAGLQFSSRLEKAEKN